MNMEISAAAQNQSPIWCLICNVRCGSAAYYENHIMGAKHKQVEAAHRNQGYGVQRSKVYYGNTLQNLLNKRRATEPAIGLEYIYENATLIYRCIMCCCETGPKDMALHVFGAKHRTAYLTKHYPEIDISYKDQMKASDMRKTLRDICFAIERKYGRKSTTVIEGTCFPRYLDDGRAPRPPINYRPDDKSQNMDLENFVDIDGKPLVPQCDITIRELSPPPPINYRPDNKLQNMDLENFVDISGKQSAPRCDITCRELSPPPPINYRPDNKLQNMDLENFVDREGKQSAPRCDITFRELKAAHEAKLSETHTSWAPVQSSTGGQECSECDPDEFMCNRELFEFLDSFKIINDTDVSFILKVTESFSNALVRYKKNSAEKKVLDVTRSSPQTRRDRGSEALSNTAGSNAPHSNINQPSIPSAHGFNRYPEPATNYTPNQLFPPVSQFNTRGPITEPRFPLSVGSASNIPQGQWPNRMPPPYTAVPSPCFVPFPQGMPPPAMPPNVSSGFPPGFPLPKDEANFFASIKNMEVPEVMATLNNIAATNPAFRGIHVPSLMRHLSESGRLKTPSYNRYLHQ